MARCSKCARDAHEGPYCCTGCATWDIPVHTIDCNKRTFPEWDGAQYIDDPQAAGKIVERAQKSLILANMLVGEFKLINEAGRRWIPGWPDSLETMIHHLQLDITYCEREARKLLES